MKECTARDCGCSTASIPQGEPPTSADHRIENMINSAENSSPRIPRGQTTVLHISGMCCPTEEGVIRSKLTGMAGVHSLEFNLVQRTMTLSHTSDALQTVLTLLESLGLGAEVLDEAVPDSDSSSVESHKTNWWPIIISGVAASSAEIVTWLNGGFHWMVAALTLVVIVSGGLPTYKKGIIALRNRNLNMNALMTVAVTGAMLIGKWPEAAMVLFLFALAEIIETKSLDRARKAISGLMALAPEIATVRQPDGSWAEIPAKDVTLEAVIRVKPGERIALDGEIISGSSTINQAPITGESLPVEKSEGDAVFSGTINEAGSFEYRVTALASNSTLARIIHAVEAAQSSRAPTQRFIDRFARIYTPVVFTIALMIAVVPPLVFGAVWMDWIYKALVLLVVACPCALVISTPVTIVSGLASAARKGILIKGGTYLESGSKLTFLVFDKTGTITHGKPELTDFMAFSDNEQQVKHLASDLTIRSDHPVSSAIFRSIQENNRPPLEVVNFTALPGRGVRGEINDQLHFLGNHRLMDELGLMTKSLKSQLNTLERQGKTVVLLATQRTVLGLFAVADTVKETSRLAIADLHSLGIKTMMLTGDNPHTAEAIAQQVGIDEIRGNQLPEDKLESVESLLSRTGTVGMVGDGINDAPALARADIASPWVRLAPIQPSKLLMWH